MEPFITNHQLNFITKQAKNIVRATHSVNDKDVLKAFEYSALEKVLALFPNIDKNKVALFSEIVDLRSEIELNQYLEKLSVYCIPFPQLTDGGIKKLFRKVKKLNYPSITKEDTKKLTYFSWNDAGADKKFIIKEVNGKLMGTYGRLVPLNKKGICHFCHQHTEIGLYTVEVKAKGNMNYKALGNYICIDGINCNQEITDVEKIDAFIMDTSK